MKPLIIANWKMNPQSLVRAKRLFNSIKRGVKDVKKAKMVICPPFIYLPILIGSTSARQKASSTRLAFGSQDCFWEEKGAFTGEISPEMLKNLGCQYVIIGHSERRRYFNETDEIINKKIKAATKAGLRPILCVGENEKERKKGKAKEKIKSQITAGLKNIPSRDLRNLILAYEPVWAIGSGNPCHPFQAKEILSFLRKYFKKIPILYGGSVNSKNALPYIKVAGFQGFLIGGASLKAKEFIKIARNVTNY